MFVSIYVCIPIYLFIFYMTNDKQLTILFFKYNLKYI